VVEIGRQADAPSADEDHADTAPPARAERNPGASTRRTTGRAEVPPDTCVRGPSTAPLNSDEIQGRTPTGHTSYTAPLRSSAGARDNNNDDIPPGQPARYNLRPAPARHLTARLKNIRAREFEVTKLLDNSEVYKMESREDHVVKRKPRTVDQKRKRRDRERGPWKCPLCEVCEFSSINGLRDHCALTHRHYCSWTGKIRPFQTFEEEQKFVDGIRKGRQHRRGVSSSTVTVVVAAGTSESSHPSSADAVGSCYVGPCRRGAVDIERTRHANGTGTAAANG
jgi:hypothetical protein